jgi:hypothetical protein
MLSIGYRSNYYNKTVFVFFRSYLDLFETLLMGLGFLFCFCVMCI